VLHSLGYGYIDNTVTVIETRTTIARQPPEMIWNLCHLILHTYDLAFRAGREQVERLFLEGRLKKRRRRGRVQVEVTARKRADVCSGARRPLPGLTSQRRSPRRTEPKSTGSPMPGFCWAHLKPPTAKKPTSSGPGGCDAPSC